jgi:hypothetical protein
MTDGMEELGAPVPVSPEQDEVPAVEKPAETRQAA